MKESKKGTKKIYIKNTGNGRRSGKKRQRVGEEVHKPAPGMEAGISKEQKRQKTGIRRTVIQNE
jgi:hypothetical protein